MKKLFSKSRIQVEEMLQDVTDFTKEMYKQKSAVYSPASPWGQIQTVLARHAQLMLYYIEDAVTESNIHTASRPQSIRGLARVAGHNPMRAIASTGEVFLSYGGSAPQINGENVIIPNYTKITCKDNQLDYLFKMGPVIGLNATVLKDFVDYTAVSALKEIGIRYNSPAPKTTPIPWFNKHVDTSKKQTALQENESTNYVIGVMTDSIDYEELPNI